jgi:predicted dehydrogenase
MTTPQGAPLRFAILGTGFWARYQLSAWRQLTGAVCVALYNRTSAKAEALAADMGVDAVYADAEELIRRERPDFLDIITSVETHAPLVRLAARHGVPVICQKPMATSFSEAQDMVRVCSEARVPFHVHENWRWQAPLRCAGGILRSGTIGRPFRARLSFVTSFPVFDNQPFLRDVQQFIIADVGSHLLDAARYLLGELELVACRTQRVTAGIRGEDVATILLRGSGGVTVTCELSYASRTERERFPQTELLIEGELGSVEVLADYWVRTTTRAGTHALRVAPPRYAWADPVYDVVHASIVPCNANLLGALRGVGTAETTGEDNLKTMRLVFGAYELAEREGL